MAEIRTLLASPEARYILLVVGLFIVPRLLQRWRLPRAVTALGMGVLAGLGLHLFHEDAVISLLATFGIVSLFLFAGLEVEFPELRRGWRVLTGHVAIQLLLLSGAWLLVSWAFELDARGALLFALALVTPSTGFILDSLGRFGLDDDQRFWVKSKAIATEIVALAVLLVAVQSVSWVRLLLSLLAIAAMVLLLPSLFRLFVRRLLPLAPRSEFAFLVILALVCAAVTRALGVYYLVGAFVVGIAAQCFRHALPAPSFSQLLHAVELFASFFIPFYFFKTGLHLLPENFTWISVLLGVGFVAILVPVRIGLVVLHRTRALRRGWAVAARTGAAMVPTLVFTLVIADILQERFGLPSDLYGALTVYALVNTVLPGVLLGTPTPSYDEPEAELLFEEVAAEDSLVEGSRDSAVEGGLTEGAAAVGGPAPSPAAPTVPSSADAP